MLYDLENRKNKQIETLLSSMFGMRIRADEINALKGLGQKHAE